MNNIARKLISDGNELPQGDEKIQLSLWFTSDRRLELIKTSFKSPTLPEVVVAVRGKTAGAFSTSATFQWTAAVQALSLLLLKAVIRHQSGSNDNEPLLEGGRGSLASSLDASIYKNTSWLDLFGSDVHGDSMSRRVLKRTNPGRRRSGPVMISLNEKVLPKQSILVFLDSKRLFDPAQLAQCANEIETNSQAVKKIETHQL